MSIMLRFLSILIVCFLLPGCQSSFGPNALRQTHPAYNQALGNILNEQMLLNLVRLRYRDSPFFLKVGSVTASLAFDSSLGVASEFNLAPGGNIVRPTLGMLFSDKPTLSYQPLQGEKYLKSILSSLSFDSLLVMTQSGWSIERVFGICVERMNDLHNAPTASGPTPENAPEYRSFKQALTLMRHLQLAHELEVGPDVDNHLYMRIKRTESNKDTVVTISSLLSLDKPINENDAYLVRLDNNFLHNDKGELRIRTRSLAGVMFNLSQSVDVPVTHQQQGLVTVTQDANGGQFNWSETSAGQFFKVNSSLGTPDNAFLAVQYRGHWFYIAEDDLQTKSTFMLLMQLFELQSGRDKFIGPTLTIPVQ